MENSKWQFTQQCSRLMFIQCLMSTGKRTFLSTVSVQRCTLHLFASRNNKAKGEGAWKHEALLVFLFSFVSAPDRCWCCSTCLCYIYSQGGGTLHLPLGKVVTFSLSTFCSSLPAAVLLSPSISLTHTRFLFFSSRIVCRTLTRWRSNNHWPHASRCAL